MRVAQNFQLKLNSPRAITKALVSTTPSTLAAVVRVTTDSPKPPYTTPTSSYLILYQSLQLEPWPPTRPPVSA